MGVVHNATEAILTSHLLRNWLRVKADYLQGILIDAWSVGDVQADELRGSLRTVPGETFAVQLVRGYLYASLTLQAETGWLGWVELTQYRTDEVQVFVWDQPESEATPRLWPAGTLGADLVDWLDQHYDEHDVNEVVLTPAEQEELDQVGKDGQIEALRKRADLDYKIQLLRKLVRLANKYKKVSLERLVTEHLPYDVRHMGRIRDYVKRETGETIWPPDRRGKQKRSGGKKG